MCLCADRPAQSCHMLSITSSPWKAIVHSFTGDHFAVLDALVGLLADGRQSSPYHRDQSGLTVSRVGRV
jgi:hypothetical protein